ncbi:hypothetical protein DPEC_G00184610 [Dallia pectoralis]|uniref:Uncharacterized protein n=1 Tax=Dallia pectoralis TaxID=75939 RepID=A0ACC2GB11_DALPE|nr:hypothetical protein DPEC_G00184610 [Dallia pectoralis]
MNDSSRNSTSMLNWMYCLDQGYVPSVICQCIQVLCFLLGTPALVWCLWISLIEGTSEGLKPTQIFPINLFMVELLFCVQSLLQVIYQRFLPQNMFLQVVDFLYYISWVSRPFFQTCICVERYMAVVQPVAFIKYRLRRYRMGSSTLIWGLTIMYSCVMVHLHVCERTLNNYVIIGVYFLGLVIISLCCFFILHVLKQPGPGEVEGGRGGEKKQGTTDPQKMRAFRIVLTNLVIISMSSISLVTGYAIMSFNTINFYCNIFPMSITFNIFSVMASPVLHLHREGRLHCRKGPESH